MFNLLRDEMILFVKQGKPLVQSKKGKKPAEQCSVVTYLEQSLVLDLFPTDLELCSTSLTIPQNLSTNCNQSRSNRSPVSALYYLSACYLKRCFH